MSYYTLDHVRAKRPSPPRPTRQPHGMGDLTSALSALGRSSVKRVVFRSQISPEVDLNPQQATPRTAGQGGFSELFLRVAKPSFYAETPVGAISFAPWGEPRFNYFPLLAAGAVAAGALALGLAVRGLRK